MMSSINLSTAALVYLLRSASDVHLVDVRKRRVSRIENAHSDKRRKREGDQLPVR
jgi:CRISPR/Cas system-associated endonuclease Cas1